MATNDEPLTKEQLVETLLAEADALVQRANYLYKLAIKTRDYEERKALLTSSQKETRRADAISRRLEKLTK